MTTITLTVTARNGVPADGSLHATFDELGGLIGRADTNQLVLPDPDRSISRVHAQIVYRNGRYAVIDRGSNPIQVNGRQAGHDGELPLQDADRLEIGGYELTVKLDAAASSAAVDPFADLVGTPLARPANPGETSLIDPLAAFGHTAMPPRAAPPSARAPAAGGLPAAAAAAIPEDWNPFAPGAPASPPPAVGVGAAPARALGLDTGAPAPQPLIGDFADLRGGAGSDSLDALFGLPSGGSGTDPFAESALAQPAAQPNMAAHADPLKSLGSAARASSDTQRDTLSDLNRPFVVAPPPAAPRTDTALPARPALDGMADGAVLSWDGGGEGRTVVRSGLLPAALASAAARAPAPGPQRPPPAAVAASPSPLPQRAAVPATPTAAATDMSALLAAFRTGLATPDLKLDALTPELMELIGALLKEAAAGTVDMLLARATLKRELHANTTVIQARENNPLKFSPSAEVALQHLLAPPARGFMAAAPAMRDAYVDLRAHQFGMLAGMRAALEGVLDRFDPATLEGRLTQRSALASLLPGGRKARLWDVFTEHFAQIRTEASDDFDALFGRAFLAAYNEHVDQLRQGAP